MKAVCRIQIIVRTDSQKIVAYLVSDFCYITVFGQLVRGDPWLEKPNANNNNILCIDGDTGGVKINYMP